MTNSCVNTSNKAVIKDIARLLDKNHQYEEYQKAANVLMLRLQGNVKTRDGSHGIPKNFVQQTVSQIAGSVLSYTANHIEELSKDSTEMNLDTFKEENSAKIQSVLDKFSSKVTNYYNHLKGEKA